MNDLGMKLQTLYPVAEPLVGDLAGCDISLFGHFSTRFDVEVDRLPAKARAVLAYVALNAQRQILRDVVAGTIWAGRGELQARQSLTQALVALRRAFAGTVVEKDINENSARTLRLPNVRVDALRFTQLCASTMVADWNEAIELYQGPLLADFPEVSDSFDHWLQVERARYQELALLTMGRLARHQIENGEGNRAIVICHRFLAIDPLAEETHRLLIEAYASMGRRSDALRQFNHCETILLRELGVRPDNVTQALAASIKKDVKEAERAAGALSAAPLAQRQEIVSPLIEPDQAADAETNDRPVALLAADGANASGSSAATRMRGSAVIALVSVLAAAIASVYAVRTPPQASGAGMRYRVGEILAADSADPLRFIAKRLSDRLAEGLSTIPFVDIAPRGAAAAQSQPPGYLVGGAVEPFGSDVRIELYVSDPATAKTVAGFGADISAAAPLDMEDEILGSVGNELTVEINKRFYPYVLDTVEKREAAALKREAMAHLHRPGGTKFAYALLEKAIERDPNSVDNAATYADELLRPEFYFQASPQSQQQAVERTRALVGKFLPKHPFHRKLKYAECRLANIAADVERAIRTCEEAQRVAPWSGHIASERAAALQLAGATERALALLVTAERFGRHYPGGWVRRYRAGIINLQLHRDQDAVYWLNCAIERNDAFGPAYALLAIAYRRLGDLAASENALHRFVELGGRKGAMQDLLRVRSKSSLVQEYNSAMGALAEEVDMTFGGLGI